MLKTAARLNRFPKKKVQFASAYENIQIIIQVLNQNYQLAYIKMLVIECS